MSSRASTSSREAALASHSPKCICACVYRGRLAVNRSALESTIYQLRKLDAAGCSIVANERLCLSPHSARQMARLQDSQHPLLTCCTIRRSQSGFQEGLDTFDIVWVLLNYASPRRAMSSMAERTGSAEWQAQFERALRQLSRPQWASVIADYSKLDPIGASIWSKTSVDSTLGDRLGLRDWHDQRVNYTGDSRAYLAAHAIDGLRQYASTGKAWRLIALYYPFLRTLPLDSVGVTGAVADLMPAEAWQAVVTAIEASLAREAGRRAVPKSRLPDTRDRMEAALCYAAVFRPADHAHLIEMLVSMEAFVDDEDAELAERRASGDASLSPADASHADTVLRRIRQQEQNAFGRSNAGEGVIVPTLKKPIAMGRDEIARPFHVGQTSQALYGVAFLSAIGGGVLAWLASLMKNPNAGWLFLEGFTPAPPLIAFWIVHPAGRVSRSTFVVAAVALPLMAWLATCAAPLTNN
jgi:hypothetical protein